MARTIVYARREPVRTEARQPVLAGIRAQPPAPPPASGPSGPPPNGGGGGGSGEDSYIDKLVKYVPAEIVAVFAPAAALLGGRQGLLIAFAIICFLATPGYLFLSAQQQPPQLRPLPHYYALAAIAFAAWAIGVSPNLDSVFRLDAVVVAFMLTGAVVLIPLVDGLLAKVRV